MQKRIGEPPPAVQVRAGAATRIKKRKQKTLLHPRADFENISLDYYPVRQMKEPGFKKFKESNRHGHADDVLQMLQRVHYNKPLDDAQTLHLKEMRNWYFSENPGVSEELFTKQVEYDMTAYERWVLLQFWQNSGGQIFHFASTLLTMLANTEVRELYFNDLQLPYSFFYLHFPYDQDLELYESCEDRDCEAVHQGFTEGAFVVCFEKRFGIAPIITYLKPGGDQILLGSCYTTLQFNSADGGNFDLVKKVAEVKSYQRKFVGQDSPIHRDFFASNAHRCLDLVLSALVYLSYEGRDVKREWPAKTPARLLHQAQWGDGKISKRAYKKLSSLGFSKINFCGRKLQESYNRGASSGVEVRPHWRMGHWRFQAYGIGRLERRWRWIKPTIVRRDRGEPQGGACLPDGAER